MRWDLNVDLFCSKCFQSSRSKWTRRIFSLFSSTYLLVADYFVDMEWHNESQWRWKPAVFTNLPGTRPEQQQILTRRHFSVSFGNTRKEQAKKSEERPQMTAKFTSLWHNLLHVLLKHADTLTTNSDHIKVTTLVSLSHFSLSNTKPPCLCLCLYVQHIKVVFWIVLSCVVCFESFFFFRRDVEERLWTRRAGVECDTDHV